MLKEGKESTPGSHTLWSYVASMLCTFASRIALAVLWTWPTSGVPNLLEKLPANLQDATIAWAIVNAAPADWIRRYTGPGPAGTAGRALLHAVAGFNKHASLRKTLSRAASLAVGPRLALGAAVGAAAPLFKQLTDRVVASEPTPGPLWRLRSGRSISGPLHALGGDGGGVGWSPRGNGREASMRCRGVRRPGDDANVCVPKRWGLDDDVRRLVHGVALFLSGATVRAQGFGSDDVGRAAPVEAKARARTKATSALGEGAVEEDQARIRRGRS